MKVSKKKLLIVQSPADVAASLSILSEMKSSTVEIAVIGSVGLFNSISSLHSNVLFLTPPALSRGYISYIFWFYLNKSKNIKFINSFDEIIYPDLLNDVLSSVLVKIAKDNNLIISKYATRYDVLLDNDYSNISLITKIKFKFYSIILNMITGMKEFKIVKYNDRLIPYCSIEYDNLYKINQKSLFKKNINLDIYTEKKINFLYLDPGPGIHDILSNYSELIPIILNKLCKLGNLYIKKHPTHPISLVELNLDHLNFRYLNENLPISMINLDNFTHIIAIDSIGLSEVEGSIPVSIINLFKPTELNYLNTYVKYITSNSVNKIYFPKDIDSIDKLIVQ